MSPRRLATAIVPLVLVAAVVVVVLLSGGPDDDGGEAGPTEEPTSSSAPADPDQLPTPTSDVPPEGDAWCTAFLAFTAASNTYVATPGDGTAEALVEASRELLELGQPLGLDDAGLTALRELVAGSLVATGGPTEFPTTPPADQASFNEFLSLVCPA